MTEFFSGVRYFITGFELITKPGIKRYVVIPIIINIILFIGLFLVFRHYVSLFNVWVAAHIPTWLHWLSAILWLLFFMCFFLFFIAAFVAIANLIAAPFNSLLSEAVERYLTGKSLTDRGMLENMKDVPRIIGRQLAVLAYYVPRALILFVLFFIPIIQLISAALWFLFNAWFLTLTYLDYPTDNHRISFRETRRWLTQRRFAGLGLGVSALIASMIPLVNLVAMAAAVAGATQFWLERELL